MMNPVTDAKKIALIDFQLALSEYSKALLNSDAKNVRSLVLTHSFKLLQIAERDRKSVV